MLGKKRDHIAVFMIFYYMEYVVPSKYYVSFMVSTNTSRLTTSLMALIVISNKYEKSSWNVLIFSSHSYLQNTPALT